MTPNGPRPVVENDAYAAFARRILRAYARRIASGDIESLTLMTRLADDIDTAIGEAVTGLRALRLLLGRDRHPARRDPPGRPATLGRPVIGTAATVPLIPGSTLARGWEHPPTTPPPSIPWADFLAAEHQHAATGGCTHPIRLRGRIDAIDLATGELAPVYDTAAEPGGVLLTSCGNRRETVCPSCSAGLQARRPPARPRGPVRRQRHPRDRSPRIRACSPPSPPPRSARSTPAGCAARPSCPAVPAATRTPAAARTAATSPAPAATATTIRGSAGRCAATATTTTAAVLFNAYAGDLWRRFTTYLPRYFARLAGLSITALRERVRDPLRQGRRIPGTRRGPLPRHHPPRRPRRHLAATRPGLHRRHALPTPSPRPPPPPPSPPARPPAARRVTLRFGTQTDARPVRHAPDLPGTGRALSVQAVANYIAKYATKALDAPGIPDRPIRSALDLEALRCHAHYRRMITTAWQLGGGQLTPGPTRLCKWAHMLGYGGHFLTKSRRYSVTFGQSPPRPHRTPPRSSATPAANATPGAAPSTTPSSWSCTPGPTPEPATPPPPAPSSRSPPPRRARAHHQAATAA